MSTRPRQLAASKQGSRAKRSSKSAPTRVLVLSGPNLHRLGKRQPEIYGSQTLDDIHRLLEEKARELAVSVSLRQSNYEGELVEWIGEARAEGFRGLLLNPGALTHTSYSLYDALLGAEVPCVEVHLSNPEAREAFRRESRVAPACVAKVAGFGGTSYLLALEGLLAYLARTPA